MFPKILEKNSQPISYGEIYKATFATLYCLRNLQMDQLAGVLVSANKFHPSQMLVGNAKRLPVGCCPVRSSTRGGSSLARKYDTRVKVALQLGPIG